MIKANDQAWSDYTVQTALTITLNCFTEEDCHASMVYKLWISIRTIDISCILLNKQQTLTSYHM